MNQNTKRFGTISGVFIPNVLTIFGVILFYREGWVVGNAGLWGAVLIILLANIITLSTALSMSAITTNIKIKGGGAYYLVSRSLGPEMGGAIGLALFFAQAFSISFYIIGFTLSLRLFFPQINPLVLNLVTLGLLTLLSIFSAEIAIKAQYLIFVLVIVAIFSFFFGNLSFHIKPDRIGSFKDAGFWKTFAIFFPAVTGIFAGLSLSGDLKDPRHNIPRGTLASIFFTLVFYLVIAVWFATNFDPATLLSNKNIMIDGSALPFLVLLGIWAATLSSAIGVLLGAPRTLQALAKDTIVPNILGKGYGPADEPRLAMLVSVGLAALMLIPSNIDFVAQLLTMFFLASYGIINIIASVELLIGNPAYRPRFKVHWSVSLFGGLASFVTMFLIDRRATFAAIIIIGLIYFLITRRQLKTNWGDIRKGFWASVVEIALANYQKYKEHPRNWRPHIAVFENDKHNRDLLTDIATLIAGNSGLVSIYMFINRTLDHSDEIRQTEIRELKDAIKEKRLGFVYPEIIFTHKDKNAHLIALQADGIGSFKANTIISDFQLENRSLENHLSNLAYYDTLKKNVILVKPNNKIRAFENRIDIWISGFQANISLMLLIPFLITRNPSWNETRVLIRMVVRSDRKKSLAENSLQKFISYGRINAEVNVISLGFEDNDSMPQEKDLSLSHLHPKKLFDHFKKILSTLEQKRYNETDRERIKDIITNQSSDARLVILGAHIPSQSEAGQSARGLKKMLTDLPTTLLVKGHHNINLII